LIAPCKENIPTTQSEDSPLTLFKVAYIYGNYYIYHKDSLSNDHFNDSSEMLWYILKFFSSTSPLQISPVKDQKRKESHAMTVGEVVKFGRVSYRVSRIFLPPKNASGVIIGGLEGKKGGGDVT
jgi:hypothetical protein